MPIPVVCACGLQFDADDDLAGKRAQCSECGHILTIPDPLLPPTPAPNPAVQRSTSAPQAPAPPSTAPQPRAPQPAPPQDSMWPPQSQESMWPPQRAPQQPSAPQQESPQPQRPPESVRQAPRPQQPQQQPTAQRPPSQLQPQQPQPRPQAPQPQRPHPQPQQPQRPTTPPTQRPSTPQTQRPAPQPQRPAPQPQRPAAPAQPVQQPVELGGLGLDDLTRMESMLPASPLQPARNPLMGGSASSSQPNEKMWLYLAIAFGGGVFLLLGLMVVMSSVRSAIKDSRSSRRTVAENDAPTTSSPAPTTTRTTTSTVPATPSAPTTSTRQSSPTTSANAYAPSSSGSNAATSGRQFGDAADRTTSSALPTYSNPDSEQGSGSSAPPGDSSASSASGMPPLASGVEIWHTDSSSAMRGMTRMSGKDAANELMAYSWMTQLLPHLGHQATYDQFDFSHSWIEGSNQILARQVVPAFLNPDDDRDAWEGYPFEGLALTHFVGMSGVEDQRNVVAATLPRSDPRAGVFGYDEVARRDEITDGEGQTIMLIGSGELASPWIQGGGATVRGARENYFDPLTGFGSRGRAEKGALVVMADGSTRHISADIDPQVFRAMCTIHGSDSVDLRQLGEPLQLAPRARSQSGGQSEKKIIILYR